MSNITILIGIGIFLFTSLYMFFKLGEQKAVNNKNHFLLQLLLLFFIISSVTLLGKVSYDAQDNCSFEMINSTIASNVTAYEYDYLCVDNINVTGLTFYKSTLWFFRLIALYVFGYFVYEVLVWLNVVTPK